LAADVEGLGRLGDRIFGGRDTDETVQGPIECEEGALRVLKDKAALSLHKFPLLSRADGILGGGNVAKGIAGDVLSKGRLEGVLSRDEALAQENL